MKTRTTEGYLTEEERLFKYLRDEVERLKIELQYEKQSWKRITLKDDISPKDGGCFEMWHTADGFDVLEHHRAGDFYLIMERKVREAPGEIDVIEAISMDHLQARRTRMYRRGEIDRVVRDKPGLARVESVVIHYHEVVWSA